MTVSTLSGKANNIEYTNGIGSNSTYLFPLGCAVDSKGNVFVFDDYVNVIRKIEPSGFTYEFCGNSDFANGSYSIGFVDGAPKVGRFANITAITIDGQDNLFVIDNNRLRKITPQGVVSTITNNQSDFKSPEGLFVDINGNVYVSDTGNRKIKKVTPAGVVSTIALGFTEPKGITMDLQNNLLVCDVSLVKKVTLTGTVTTYADGFSSANGITLDLEGNCYVTDSNENRIKKVDLNKITTVFVGTTQGFQDTSLLFFWRTPKLYNPRGICIDKNGNFYIADTYNNRIRKIVK